MHVNACSSTEDDCVRKLVIQAPDETMRFTRRKLDMYYDLSKDSTKTNAWVNLGSKGKVYDAIANGSKWDKASESYTLGRGMWAEVKYNSAPKLVPNISYEVLVYPTKSGGRQYLVSPALNNSFAQSIMIGETKGNCIGQNLAVAAGKCLDSKTSPPTMEWIHLIATFNAEEVKYYLNGKLILDQKNNRDANASYSDTLVIGSTKDLGLHVDTGTKVKMVRVYQTVLSHHEVIANYKHSMHLVKCRACVYAKYPKGVGVQDTGAEFCFGPGKSSLPSGLHNDVSGVVMTGGSHCTLSVYDQHTMGKRFKFHGVGTWQATDSVSDIAQQYRRSNVYMNKGWGMDTAVSTVMLTD